MNALKPTSTASNALSLVVVASLLLGLLAAGTSSDTFAATVARPRHSFREVVARNFHKWDRNWDGRLSASEIDRLVTDPGVKGPSAAAVAAIHVYLRGDKSPTAVPESDLVADSRNESARPDKDDHRPHFAADYARFYNHLAHAPRDIFSGDVIPTLNGVSQGRLGDCYFLSVVGAAVNLNPQAVREMIHVNDDGSADVTFAGAKPVHVARLTDAEIALSSSAARQGLWVNILEKAFAQIKMQAPKARRSAADLDLDVISRGGDARQSIRLLTGHKAKYLAIFPVKNKKPVRPTAAERPELCKRIHEFLLKQCQARNLICVGTAATGKLPPRIATHHDMAVVDYDPTSGTVYLWNPWGNNVNRNVANPGLANGYPTRGGRFAMPLDEFVQVFRCAFYETQERID